MKSVSQINDRNTKARCGLDKIIGSCKKLLPAPLVGRFANRSKFVQRKTSFKAAAFFESIICAAGGAKEVTLAGINTLYCKLAGRSITHEAFHDRIKDPRAAEVMASLLQFTSNKLIKLEWSHSFGARCIKALNEHGISVKDIEIHDGTYWKLPGQLAGIFKGSRTNKKKGKDGCIESAECEAKPVPAAEIGLQTCFSFLKGVFTSVVMTSGTANEKDFVQADPRRCVLKLFDAGYYKIALLEAIAKAGSCFLIRGKGNMVGTVTDCYINGKQMVNFIGLNLRDKLLRDYNRYAVMDMDAVLSCGFKVRVIRVWSKRRQAVSFLVTNIRREQLGAKETAAIQKIRWSIELFFKQLKSGVNLRGVKTVHVSILITMVYASLIAAIIKYFVYLFLDHMSLRNISPLKVFINSDSWWKEGCLAFIQGNLERLAEVLQDLLKQSYYYERSRTSKARQAELKSQESVIILLEKSAKECGFRTILM